MHAFESIIPVWFTSGPKFCLYLPIKYNKYIYTYTVPSTKCLQKRLSIKKIGERLLLGFYIPRYLFRWADFNMPTAEFKTAKYKFRKLGTFAGREIVLHAPKPHSNDHNSTAIKSTELILCMAYTSRPSRSSWDRSRGRSSSVDNRTQRFFAK